MSKFIYDDLKQKFDIEDALTITKGKWADGNEDEEERIGYFVTSDNDSNEVEIASSDSYICGVTIKDDTFLYPDADDPSYCVVQALGLCTVKDDGTLAPGDKCMPSDGGIAVISSNSLGYRVVKRVDDNHIQIIVAPNNDMVQRIKNDMVGKANKSTMFETTLLSSGWSNKTYNLTVQGVTSTSNQEVIPALSITSAQLDAFQNARIVDGGQSQNNITLKAYGSVPTINIPIRVILRGDM